MKRYFTILNLILATITIYFVVDIFYTLVTAGIITTPLTLNANKQMSFSQTKARHGRSYYNAISKRNLFNLITETTLPDTADKIDVLEKTSLDIKLWGTIIGTDNKNFAVIESSRKQNLYHTGDTIQNAEIKVIYREKIVLRVNGKDEILEMEKVSSSDRKPSSQDIKQRASTTNINVKRSKIEAASQNINELMKQVNIRPYFEKGKPRGLMLSRIRPHSIFQELGLKNGDVITGVNGEPIDTVDNVLKLYKRLKTSNNAKLDIKRRGRNQSITYTIE